jgi:hypothetical protein
MFIEIVADDEANDDTEAHLDTKRTVTEKGFSDIIPVVLHGHFHLISDFISITGAP